MANFTPSYGQGIGARLGNQLGDVLGAAGQGAGAGIQYNTEQILKDLAQRKAEGMRAEALRQFMPHASQQELQALSSFPEDIQFQALQGGFGQQAPQSGLEALKQIPFSPEQAAALQSLPEQQRNQILQRLQQNPQVQQRTQQKLGLGQALQRQAVAGKAGAAPKLNPADQKFDTKVVNDVEPAAEIIDILDQIDEVLGREQYSYGALTDWAPQSLKGATQNLFGTPEGKADTLLLDNLMNALLTKQTLAESQGQRGSDLLRNMIRAGKLNLGQPPEVLRDISKRLRKDKEFLGQARNMLFEQNGYAPRADQTQQLAAKLQQNARKGEKLAQKIDAGNIKTLPKDGSSTSFALEGEIFSSPEGPVVYINGRKVPYNESMGSIGE
jgi:hypothetical protein